MSPTRTFTVQIEGNILWQFAQDPETQQWVGVCHHLNLNALGDTFAEVQACASDAMEGLFRDLLESNELDEFLRQNGWRVADGLPAPGQQARFDVPYRQERTTVKELLAATA